MTRDRPPLRLVTSGGKADDGTERAYCPECSAKGLSHSHGVEVVTNLRTNGRRVRRSDDSHTLWICPHCLAGGKVVQIV